MIYVCPICGGALSGEGGTVRCPARHAFDYAKEGYVNLLVGASGGTHGDNREMVLARRRFLSGGYYAPLAEAVASAVLTCLPRGGTVLDGGAGEGYYTDLVARAVTAADPTAEVYAFDISKDAVRLLAKKNAAVRAAVAGVYKMPVRKGSVDVALNLFAPLATDEIHRVLKENGTFLMAIPEREHLFGLKSAVYDTPYYNDVADPALPGFSLVSSIEIKREITLRGEAIRDLFMMTPYAYRTNEAGRARVAALEILRTPVHFRLFLYRRLPDEK